MEIKFQMALRSAREKGHYSMTSSWTKTVQGSWTGMEGLKVGGSMTMNDAPKDDGTTVGVNLTEFNATYSANNMYARMEYGMIDYTDGPINDDGVALESSSGYYLDLGYDIAGLVGCGDNSNLYLWMRNSAYNTNDIGDNTEISHYSALLTNQLIIFHLNSKQVLRMMMIL